MAVAFGTNAWLGIGDETTYGTSVTPTKFLEIVEESIQGKQNFIAKPTLRSPSQRNRVKSKKSVEGAFKFQFPLNGAEKILKHGLGAVTDTGTNPTYTHDYKPATVLPTGLTLHVNRDAAALGVGTAFQYEGCQIQKITFTQEIEDFLMCEVEVVGEDWNNVNVVAPTFPTFYGFDWEMLTITALSGHDLPLNLKSLELTIENQLASDRYKLGSRLRKGLGRNGARKVSGKLSMELEDLQAYLYFKQLATTDMNLKWSSGSSSIEIYAPMVTFSGDDPTVKDAGPIALDLSFECHSQLVDNDEITITLINSTASGS